MGRPITVNVPHALNKADARRRIEDGFAAVQQQLAGGVMRVFSFQERWEGDRLHFQGGSFGQNIHGQLDLLDNSVQIQVDLPEVLAVLADRIAGRLKKETQILLEKSK